MEQVKRGRGRPPKPNRGERKPYRFFKIILPCVLQQHSLRIPEKFATTFSSEYSVAKLSLPTGLVWKVAISRSQNKLYFTQGWEEFLVHNAIKLGYFLEFEHRGNCNFRVHIFDLSCCEIDYLSTIPSFPIETEDPNNQLPLEEESMQVKEEEEEAKDVFYTSGMFGTSSGSASFTITMTKSHCTKNELYVPRYFMRNFMLRKFVKIQTDDGREWSLRCNHYRHSLRLSGYDWTKFRKENKLELGDTCTFELVGDNLHSVTLKASKK